MYQLYKGDTPLATFVPKDASELPYSNGVSVKDKIDGLVIRETFNTTTDENGNVLLPLNKSRHLLNVVKLRNATDSTYAVSQIGLDASNNTYIAHFTGLYNQPYASVNCDIQIEYI